MKIAIGLLFIVLVAWSLWGYFSSKVEQASYTVVKEADGYELREYPEHIVAQTTVQGSYEEALAEGFTIVASYIFGGNIRSEGIAMTAPVTDESASEQIAMTAPVTVETENGARTISFVMPKRYTLESLPKPTDDRVKLVVVPKRTMAALSFSWYRTPARVERMRERIIDLLQRDNVEVLGGTVYAGYNAPWTPPWMVRNEILVEVRHE